MSASTKHQTEREHTQVQTSETTRKRLTVVVRCGIVAILIFSGLLATAKFHPQITIDIPAAQIKHLTGQAYSARIQHLKRFGFKFVSDSSNSTSDLIFCEDTRNGKRANLPQVIFDGRGAYKHQGDFLYFSSFDNTNPAQNHRHYSIFGSITPTARTIGTSVFFLVLSLVITTSAFLSASNLREIEPSSLLRLLRYPFLVSKLDIRNAIFISKNPGLHVPELDGVRGYACIAVLLAHCLIGLLQPLPGSFLLFIQSHTIVLLLDGVDLFFVLSGFLIGGILIDSKKKPHYFQNFWIRRAARILPVLWLLLTSYALALSARQILNLKVMDLWLLADPKPPFWTYATFMQSIPIALGGYGGPRWVGITWSLAIEEQFYMIFPIAVYFLSRRSIVLTAIAGILVAPVLRSYFAHAIGNWYAPYVLMPSRIDGLMFGVLVASIVRNARSLCVAVRFRWVLDLTAVALIYILATGHPLLHMWADEACGPFPPLKQSMLALLSAILILRIFVSRENRFNKIWRNKVLCAFGLVSYGLYMYHQSINGSVHAFFFGQEPRVTTFNEFFASLSVMSIAIFVSWVSYILIEKRCRAAGYRLCEKLKKQTAPVKGHFEKSDSLAKN